MSCAKSLQVRWGTMWSKAGLAWAFLCFALICPSRPVEGQVAGSLELSRPVRSWEFLPIVGTKASLFGNERGEMEAWVYPLKLFRNFHLVFHVDGHALPAES